MHLQSREDLIADLQSKKFRDAFVSSRVSNTLALQIRAMRQERGWSQAYLAELLGTSQNAVYRLESPQYGKPSITTLKRLAAIFDVGLAVWFTPFSKLVDRVTNLSTDDILVPSFDNDPGFHEREAASAKLPRTTAVTSEPVLTDSLQQSQNTVGEGNTPLPEGRPSSMPMLQAHESKSLPEQSSRPLRRHSTPLVNFQRAS